MSPLNTDTVSDRLSRDTDLTAGVSSTRWSDAISQRYHLRLSDQLTDWFDGGVCDRLGGSEFCEPAAPEILLQAEPDCIWPGLMPPDFLPLVSNGLGDWLCGRVSTMGTIDEIVYWYHGGGDFIPYGKSLAEAIVFDSLVDRLPGRRQLHAIPAHRDADEHQSIVSRPLVQWALQHLPSSVAQVMHLATAPQQIASELLRHGIAVDAVRCDAVLAAMDTELRRRMTPRIASEMGASWERDVTKWLFDTDLIPGDFREQLVDRWPDAGEGLFVQDWTTVASECRAVLHNRKQSDLGWTHDCLGWIAQREGDHDLAAKHYALASQASLFSDQAVRFRTHFSSDRFAKFSIARLSELGREAVIDRAYFDLLSRVQEPNWRDGVANYWHGSANGVADRYRFNYLAGWDVGCDSMASYGHRLQQLADAASDVGDLARAELARTHAACIESRYRKPDPG